MKGSRGDFFVFTLLALRITEGRRFLSPAKILLSPAIPIHTRHSAVTPMFPLHTQKQGGIPLKNVGAPTFSLSFSEYPPSAHRGFSEGGFSIVYALFHFP